MRNVDIADLSRVEGTESVATKNHTADSGTGLLRTAPEELWQRVKWCCIIQYQ